MKIFLTFIGFFAVFHSFGQIDSTQITTYDLIYMKNGDILKGQIISFDISDGDITFVDERGNRYFISPVDYSSYKENIPYKKRKLEKMSGVERVVIVNDRKENEFELSIGFTVPFYNISGKSATEEDFHLNFQRAYVPLCLSAGFGKYINRKHFIGASFDFGTSSDIKSFYSVNAKYAHQYDQMKKNVALYIPVELSFNHFRNKMPFRVDQYDTTYYADGGYSASYPGARSYDISFNSIGLSVGHGFGYILGSRNSISIELAYFKNFILNTTYHAVKDPEPQIDFAIAGVRFNLKYNF